MTQFNRVTKKHLGELLIEGGVLTPKQLEEALAVQKEKGGLIGEVLVGLGYAREEDIIQALTCQYGFPYLPLANYEIDADVIKAVPVEVARKHCLMPIDRIGKSLTVAMANPLNTHAIEEVEQITGFTVQAFVSTSGDILECMRKYYGKEN